jgi:poly-gamma-glutamate synthesis protein (capsule biosynthesis protein)
LFDPARPLARELEMSLDPAAVTDVIAVGDLVISRPLSHYGRPGRDGGDPPEPAFARLLELLSAPATRAVCGNLETVIFELRGFSGAPYAWDGDWALSSTPAVADDLAAMGFTLLSRANNHAFDWGIEGVRETSRRLDRAGIAHAGTGDTLALARAAAHHEGGAGRIALVSCTATFRETTGALPARGTAPARPGVSAIAVSRETLVAPNVFELAGRLAAALPDTSHLEYGPRPGQEPGEGVVSLLGHRFVRDPDAEGGRRVRYRHTIDEADLASVAHAIRLGKQHADFLIAALHSHEPATSDPDSPPGGLTRTFARAAVEAGADMVVVTGIHRAGPVEIHRGCPIFHGLGNFFWSDIQEPLPHDLYARNADRIADAFAEPSGVTDADLTNLLNAGAGNPRTSFNTRSTFTSVLGRCRYARGRLQRVDLFPVDLGWPPRRLTRSGIPRLAAGELAEAILTDVARLSAPFGCEVEIVEEEGATIGRIEAPGARDAPEPSPGAGVDG